MKILFLDIDGVLNNHTAHPGSVYNGIDAGMMAHLNRVLRMTDTCVMLCSAWRYQIICGATTMRGFEFMLHSHGLIPRANGSPWLIGHTPSDEAIEGRGEQIRASLYSLLPRSVESWCVLDDDPMHMRLDCAAWRLVKTDGKVGMTARDADAVVDVLIGKEPAR